MCQLFIEKIKLAGIVFHVMSNKSEHISDYKESTVKKTHE